MLTAKTKSGKKINLGNDYKKETLLLLRNQEEFICPVCGEEVTLKLGNQRIFHFAHKKVGTCRDFYERESVYHMDGKRQLYQWLVQQKIPSVLEYYDREIEQRPDVMFVYQGKKYALEYQCSTISETVFLKRTRSYLENGYTPLWIVGGKQIHQHKRNVVSLSNFDYLFLRRTTEGKFHIPSYCPDQRLFHFLDSIYSYSVKNAFTHNSFISLNKLRINDLLNPQFLNQIPIEQWNQALEKFHLNWSLHPGIHQQAFQQEIYKQNLNPFLLPPEIGLPVQHSLLIQTSPMIWQTYFYLDVLSKKRPKDVFSFHETERCFNMRIRRKEIIIRNLPQFEGINPMNAVNDYLKQLEKIGMISRIGEKNFQLQRNLVIPHSNREMEEQKKLFYMKYHVQLSKT